MEDCLFCKIANSGQNLVWENQYAAAFNDIHPKAPVHILVVPKKHIGMLDELDDVDLGGHLLMAVREVAHNAGLKGGYRVVINNGKPVGQTVEHLHLHILGGKSMPESSLHTRPDDL